MKIHLLIVEDTSDDADLLALELRRQGFNPTWERVETLSALDEALQDPQWEILILDHSLPQFTAFDVLKRLSEKNIDLPAIIVSGTTGEEIAVEAIKAGAYDYLLKDKLSHLGTAINRALREAEEKRYRKRVEQTLLEQTEELKRQNTILKTQQEASLDAILVVDQDHKIISYNQRFVDMWDISNLDIESVSDARARDSVLHKLHDPEQFVAKIDYLYTNHHEESKDEILLLDGRILDRYSTPMFSDDGVYHGRIWYFRDITARRKMEENLRQSEERLRTVINSTPLMVWVLDQDGVFSLFEGQGLQGMGLSPGELVGQSIFEVYAGESEVISNSKRALTGESFQTTINRKDKILDVWYTPTQNEQGEITGMIGIAIDITEKRQIEEQLRQSQKMEAIGSLAGGVAHDFNNLLTIIIGYCGLMMRKLQPTHPFFNLLEEIKKAGHSAASLTNQLLVFSRKQVLQPTVLNLNTVITDTLKMLKRLIGENIQLTTSFEALLRSVKVDQGQVEQIFINLAVNARDAMPQGGHLSISTKNCVFTQSTPAVPAGEYVVLEVTDTGCGMTEATLKKIFEPFFTTKEPGKGTGLGLATVYGIVKQSQGYIEVKSQVDTGTTFKIYFPQYEAVLETESLSLESELLLTGSETILVVEDEAAVGLMVENSLKDYGYKVLSARNGLQALEICHDGITPVDLVITDVIMPKMSGKELVDKLKLTHSNVKVLFMSGYTDEIINPHGVLDEGIEFISKPFMPEQLLQKVRDILG